MVTEPAGPPFKATLWIKPAFRTDFIDVRAKLAEEFGSEFARYPKALYISDHTTAGYLDQRLAQRLEYDQAKLQEFIRVFHEIFPPNAGYVHDELDLRTELSDEQRATEPENADSHLTSSARDSRARPPTTTRRTSRSGSWTSTASTGAAPASVGRRSWATARRKS